jgi:hypothetical protein
MSLPMPVTRPEPGWAVLYWFPPEIQLVPAELDQSGMRIVRIDDHFLSTGTGNIRSAVLA